MLPRILFITKSLDFGSISLLRLTSSSQVFEFNTISMLSKFYDVHVLCLGRESVPICTIDNLRFRSINYMGIMGWFRYMFFLCGFEDKRNITIITSGYYFGEIFLIYVFTKVFKCRAFSYVYDTHKMAISKFGYIKKLLSEVYFRAGFELVIRLSGLMVLNDAFIKKKHIKTRYLLTMIGVADTQPADRSSFSDEFRRPIIVFAGTMNEDNGINLIIDIFQCHDSLDCDFHIYGDGEVEMVDRVIDLCKANKNVKYFGRILDSQLQERLSAANYLLNLRDPLCPACDYAFPSKLINFMASGTPVITNIFPGLTRDYYGYLNVIDAYSSLALHSKIRQLISEKYDRTLGQAARNYIVRKHSLDVIGPRVLDFIR